MEFELGDEIKFDDKSYVLMSDMKLNNKTYFLLATTEKPITGIIVEYRIENNELQINENVDKEIMYKLLENCAKDLKIDIEE